MVQDNKKRRKFNANGAQCMEKSISRVGRVSEPFLLIAPHFFMSRFTPFVDAACLRVF